MVDKIVKTITTDAEGRATFENLDTELPEGAAIVVQAVLAEGEAPTSSQSFVLGETAYAVILSRGTFGEAQPAPPPEPVQPQGRLALPGPRADKSLAAGQVRVFVIDAHDQPVADQLVVVHSSEAGGGSGNRSGRTDAQGMVILDEVPSGPEESCPRLGSSTPARRTRAPCSRCRATPGPWS